MDANRRLLLLGAAGAAAASAGMAQAQTRTAVAQPKGPLTAPWTDVRRFGAKGDGTTIDSPAINAAIDYAASKGGGTVFFPAGTYNCYSIRLKSNITLHLDAGAAIVAATVPQDGLPVGGYDHAEPQDPAIERYQDYGHNHWHNSLIWGEGLHDIAVTGTGLIWGKGLSQGVRLPNLPNASAPGVANKMFGLKNCRNVLLRDFHALQGGHFVLLATGVDNLTIDNLTVDTNRDGFDIDCCKNVRVTNCRVNSPNDDAICPKSSFALGYARATENVHISNCHVSANYVVGSVIDGTFKPAGRGETKGTGRIKCGTESNGGFKNITITNCIFEGCQGFALETVDGALLEDVTISNVTMRNCVSAPLFLRLGRRMRGPEGVPIGTLKRILIENITSYNSARLPSIIAGIEGHPVEDVKISNVYFQQVGGADAAAAAVQPPANEQGYPEPGMFGALPATGFFVRHARNVEMSNVEIVTAAADARPAFWMQDVDGVDIFRAKVPSGTAYALERVTQFRSFGSRSTADVLLEKAPANKIATL
jgi:polygalacturonase